MYAIVSAGAGLALLYVNRDEAERELEEILRDEPEWRYLLRLEPVVLTREHVLQPCAN